jgi:short-subunit dehydrogenase
VDTVGRPLALVTGASSGIGRELAKQFARHGFDVIVAAEDDAIADAAAELRAAGASAEAVQVDLALTEGVEELYHRATEGGRRLDAVAINAGIGVSGDFARGDDLESELRLVDLNVRSAVHLAKRVLHDMAERGTGRVLFTSSIAATMPGPYYAVYAASKAFLHSFAEGLRYELKDTDVTVTALLPGATDTDFFARADMEDTKAGQGQKDDPAEVARDGFEALMKGDDKVVAGAFKNKAATAAARILPEPIKAALQARNTKPAGERRTP